MSEEVAPEVPYYLMPVAALCGTYALIAGVKAVLQVYKVFTYNAGKEPTAIPPSPFKSKQFLTLFLSIVVSAVGYGYICAQVNNSLASADVFDPFEILDIQSSANITVVKSAYRTLSKTHHPDKGGDTATFQKINLAYKALSDDTARANWEQHGHPDGPQTQTLSFALPDWLLHPEGKIALVLVLMYLAMFVGIVVYMFKFVTKTEEDAKKRQWDNSVSQSDMAYLATHLRPDSTHLDVLFYIATCPESLEITNQTLAKTDEIKAARIEFLNPSKKEKKKEEDSFDFNSDEGWADDDDEATKAAKAKKEEKEKLAKQVAEASGKDQIAKNIKIEGLDDGVLGQAWVERTLEGIGQWPPKFDDSCNVKTMTFSNDKSKSAVSVLENRAARRNLCMTLGRLNALKLNTHPELLEAGKKNLIDPTYFKSTMEYRQRTGLLLEASLRVAGSVRSYRLYKTIVECVSMFKIGTNDAQSEKTIAWFKDIMQKTYNGPTGVPRIIVSDLDIETPGEDEIATDDACKLSIDINRPHAENFTKQKIAMAAKQGIPPQIALQTFREGWWILVRCKKLDGDVELNNEHLYKNPLLAALDNGAKKQFESEGEENRLLNAWPFIVSNIQQKEGKVNVSFKAPAVAGKYRFFIDIKSQEFLGCDQVFKIEKEVVDKAVIERKQAEENAEEDDNSDDEEPKKTK